MFFSEHNIAKSVANFFVKLRDLISPRCKGIKDIYNIDVDIQLMLEITI